MCPGLFPLLLPVMLAASPEPASIASVMPAGATYALFIESIDDALPQAIEAMDRTIGWSEGLSFRTGAPLPYLAAEALSEGGASNGIDRRGGLGLFRIPELEGAVGVVAVGDEALALGALEQRLVELGGVVESRAEGAIFVRADDGVLDAAFVARGHLYLVLPDWPLEDLAGLVEILRGERGEGLSGTDLYRRTSGHVEARPWAVRMFVLAPDEVQPRMRAAFLTLSPEPRRIRIDGWVEADVPATPPRPRGGRRLLEQAPGQPLIVASSWIDPATTRALLCGAPGEELDIADAALCRSAGERLDLLAYASPGLSLELVESVGVEVDLREPIPAGELEGVPFEVRVSDTRAQIWLGQSRPRGPLSSAVGALRRRFGADAFGPGHVTVFADLARLRGTAGLAGSLARHLFIDFRAEPSGLRASGELALDPAPQASPGGAQP